MAFHECCVSEETSNDVKLTHDRKEKPQKHNIYLPLRYQGINFFIKHNILRISINLQPVEACHIRLFMS